MMGHSEKVGIKMICEFVLRIVNPNIIIRPTSLSQES